MSRWLYSGWTRPRDAGMFGATTTATWMGIGLAIFVMIAFLLPVPGAVRLGAVFLSIAALLPLLYSRRGQSGWGILFTSVRRARNRSTGEHLYRSGPGTEIAQTRLPGILAGSQATDHVTATGRSYGLIRVGKFYTVVLRVWPQGSEWIDQKRFDELVSGFGSVIAFVGHSPDVEAISTVIETVPESGQRAAAQLARQTKDARNQKAAQILWEATYQVPTAVVRQEARIAITFDSDKGGNRRDTTDQAKEIGRRLPRIMDIIENAGLPCRPMASREMAAVARRSYSPSAEFDIEEALLGGDDLGFDWLDAGPVSSDDMRGYVLHDGGKSTSWTMLDLPSSAVDSRVLEELLAPRAELPRKRVTIVHRPHSPAESTKIVDGDLISSERAVRSRVGRVSESARLRLQATQRSRTEQALGAGVTRVSMLVTATIGASEDFARTESLITDLSVASRLKLIPADGGQAVTFAGSLGLGLVLPSHASLSDRFAG